MNIRVTGNKELVAKLQRLSKKLDTEPTNTIQKVADIAYLHALVVAPRRTGKLTVSIKKQGGRNWARVSVGSGLGYPAWIDMGIVPQNWGTSYQKNPKIIDKRPPEEKLYYFVGTESHPGKTLTFVREMFPGMVEELGRRLEIR